eukprot:CAMPEP_0197519694 /NCGR_PEP_ID=MMETSP1318-20131121/4964_1 /TAXON_ID=552666 /ORGANISM="Partenskyella glossopodia, Strain RCC365" /LENGTH=606 /DNA_ID=CAMNT_0043070831 /DNA_START=17 /DNA_END=1837 /DNA_ORIENTATION=-
MIEQFSIFTKGGAVLWSRDLEAGMDMSGVNSLVREVFLGERSGETSYQFVYEASKYLLKWAFNNELGLIFVAVYPAILNNQSLLLIEEILLAVSDKFSSLWKKNKLKGTSDCRVGIDFAFDKHYDAIVDRFENIGSRPKHRVQRSFKDTKKGSEKKKPNKKEQQKEQKRKHKAEQKSKQKEDEQDNEISEAEAKALRKQAMLDKLKRGRNGPRKFVKKKSVEKKSAKKGKKARNWGNDITEEEAAALDFGQKAGSADAQAERARLEEFKKTYMPNNKVEFSDSDVSSDDDDDGDQKGKSSGFFSFFKSLTGQKPLTREDLTPVLAKIKSDLMSKNVAVDIAEKICESVTTALIGRVVGTFGSVRGMVKEAVEKALTRILTPKRVINILPEIQAARRENRPYVIVFIGVNGVGKSTSLAKVCAYLQSKGLTVSIAACDTFRSGAVEQLRTHTKCLDVRLFEKGYNRDAAGVASDAITEAKQMRDDVVLVDTAGRMQDNLPLMRALAKLVAVNHPDLVLFVGEALVGNDAVDQVTRFNRALTEFSTAKNPRLIDGMILTKFDTIDDKVGAAISLTYVTGKPIIFVGTGQTYGDLKKMNVKMLIRMLLR